MRSALATAMAVTLLHVAGSGVSWRTAHPSDSLAKPWAVSETWDLRAVAPKGRRAVVIRFWTKGNPWWIEWLTYERGRGVGSWPEPVEPAAHSGPGVSMKDKCGRSSLRRSGSRWLLDACATKDKLSAHLVLRAVHPGLTIGPVRVSNRRAAWLSVVATGLVDGVVHTPNGAIRIRGWYGVHEHEWATYQHYESWAYVRRDLALLWRSPDDIRLVWGLEPFRSPRQAGHPVDSIWRGISARLGAQRSVCIARVHRGGLVDAWPDYFAPTTTLTARCGGSTLHVHHPDGKIGGTRWTYSQTFTGLATSNVGGVGFLEETVPALY